MRSKSLLDEKRLHKWKKRQPQNFRNISFLPLHVTLPLSPHLLLISVIIKRRQLGWSALVFRLQKWKTFPAERNLIIMTADKTFLVTSLKILWRLEKIRFPSLLPSFFFLFQRAKSQNFSRAVNFEVSSTASWFSSGKSAPGVSDIVNMNVHK